MLISDLKNPIHPYQLKIWQENTKINGESIIASSVKCLLDCSMH